MGRPHHARQDVDRQLAVLSLHLTACSVPMGQRGDSYLLHVRFASHLDIVRRVRATMRLSTSVSAGLFSEDIIGKMALTCGDGRSISGFGWSE